MDTADAVDEDADVEPIALRAEDKRAAELQELRQKNLAKTMIQQGQLALDGIGQPIDKEGFYQQQKYQSEQLKQQQMHATQYLHSYRNANVTTIDGQIKSNTKKKELEAAAMLHSYRGKPEAVLSHQVKKISTIGSRDNLTVHDFSPTSIDASSSLPGTNFGDARNVFRGIPKDNTDTGTINSGANIESLVLIQDLDYDDNNGEQGNIAKKASESSNENSTESTGWVVLKEDQEQNASANANANTNANANVSSDDFAKIDIDCTEDESAANVTPLPQSVEDAPRQHPPSAKPLPTWTVEYVSASFGLLTDANEAPPVGEGIGNHLLTNMVQNMQTVVQSALQGYIDGGVVQLLNSRYELLVARDGKLKPKISIAWFSDALQ